eukprot:CCRYP_006075-RA/>CCRYP_006075-RA protein AED:0.03 eAED:0.03 QI:187/1/1/1/0.5/0.33/3/325/312
MLTHRVLQAKSNCEGGDMELGNGSEHEISKPLSPSHYEIDLTDDDKKTHFSSRIFFEQRHLNIKSAKTILRTTTLWGALVFVGYRIGLGGPPETPPSVKWLLKPPPTLKQMYYSRNCDMILNSTRPIYTEEQWQRFRDIWKLQGGKDPSKRYKRNDWRNSKAPPDLVPPLRAAQTTDGRGRGVFATRDIKKGEMTYGGTKHYIFFYDGHSYRRFLDALSDDEACDIMKFTWPQDGVGTNGEPVIWGPMDDMALQNDGGEDRANIGCPEDKHCGMFDEYALRDIKKGEELLCDYSQFFSLDFLEYDMWKEFGL